MEVAGGDTKAIFMDLRAELLSLDFDSTGVVAEARALIDWNKRSECIHLVSKRSSLMRCA